MRKDVDEALDRLGYESRGDSPDALLDVLLWMSPSALECFLENPEPWTDKDRDLLPIEERWPHVVTVYGANPESKVVFHGVAGKVEHEGDEEPTCPYCGAKQGEPDDRCFPPGP